MSSSFAQLKLKKEADRRLKAGHLWIYSNEVDVAQTPLSQFEAGQLVELLNSAGKSLGLAHISPKNLICARLLTRKTADVDAKWWVKKLREALALREAFFTTPHYRLVYGEADYLPGLVIDRFGEGFVVQTSTAGMDAQLELIVEGLKRVFQPEFVCIKNDSKAREMEGLAITVDCPIGTAPEEIEICENGVQFVAPLVGGQKTGWFYDHRDNRHKLNQWVGDKTVLDVFSYVGGWGVQAAAHGASRVVCVDSSAQALEYVGANAELNGCLDKVEALQGKAIDALKMLINNGEKFDAVVVDPPAFIKKRKDHRNGLAGYRHINELAMRLVDNGGLIVSASCSMHLKNDELVDVMRGASRHIDRRCQLVAEGGQAADHPIHPAIAETKYLKAVFARISH